MVYSIIFRVRYEAKLKKRCAQIVRYIFFLLPCCSCQVFFFFRLLRCLFMFAEALAHLPGVSERMNRVEPLQATISPVLRGGGEEMHGQQFLRRICPCTMNILSLMKENRSSVCVCLIVFVRVSTLWYPVDDFCFCESSSI